MYFTRSHTGLFLLFQSYIEDADEESFVWTEFLLENYGFWLIWHWSTALHFLQFSNKISIKACRGIFMYSAAGFRPAEGNTHACRTHTPAQAIIISIHLAPLSPRFFLYQFVFCRWRSVCICFLYAGCDAVCHMCLLHMNKTCRNHTHTVEECMPLSCHHYKRPKQWRMFCVSVSCIEINMMLSD